MQVAFTCQWTNTYFKVGEIYEVWWDTLRGQPQRVPFDTTTLHKHQTNAKSFCPVVRHEDLTDASKASAARGTSSPFSRTQYTRLSASVFCRALMVQKGARIVSVSMFIVEIDLHSDLNTHSSPSLSLSLSL